MIPGVAFYGVTLDAKNKTSRWTQKWTDGPGGGYVTKLAVKQILLGHDAKKGEVNVVEVSTESWDNDSPAQNIEIAVLKLGETQSSLPNLEFPSDFVLFTLIRGSGPVHISGLQFADISHKEFSVIPEDEGDCDYDEDEEQVEPSKDGKQK